MSYRNKTYVIFDADNDMWAYAYMMGWKNREHIDFNFHNALDLVHAIRKAQKRKGGGSRQTLWPWQRNQAYKHVVSVMREAGITGLHASPKGLRHGFGVKAATETRNPRMVQKWLGHRSLETTAIYMDAVDDEERELAIAMWE